MAKETNLPIKSSFSNTTDYVRMTVGGISSVVTPTVLASAISSLISSSVNKLKIRHVTGAGAVLATDNVVTLTGTFAITMPNPSTVYDAANTQSNEIVLAMKGSGTVTVNPYDAESFLDGTTQSSLSLNGSYVRLVTDGTDWIVVGS